MRSLYATFLRNRIIGALRNAQDEAARNAASNITQNFVFEHPTLRELAEAISDIIQPHQASGKTSASGATNGQADAAAAILSMLEKYSVGLPTNISKSKHSSGDEIVVLLTGSTGNVGSQLLAALIAEWRVKKVYTLNRPSPAVKEGEDRQRTAFEERKLPVKLLNQDKYVPLYGDLSVDGFGLEQTVYEEVSASSICLSTH